MPEIKPCPFCGSENWAMFDCNSGRYCVLVCEDCAAQGPYGSTEEEAKEAWNRRADDGAD